MRRRFLARTCGVFAVLVLASCFGESTGPGELRPGRFAIAPVFDAQALRLVPVDRVHIILYHADNTVALDTTVVFPAGSDTLDLSFEVDIQGSSEPLGLDVTMLDPNGAVVFQAPRTTVIATAGSTAPPPATPPMLYVGPGANAVGVRFLTTHSQVFFGDTVLFTAEAFDANNAVVATAPIAWSSSDTSRARLPDPDVGRFIGNNTRGPATVRAGLLRTSATVAPAEVTNPLLVQPKPNQIAVQAGNNQSGPIGSPLALPVTARVRAADNLGVQGVTVTFVVSAGGGSLSSATAVTDANGDASVTWTLGPALGPQSVTATAAGVSGQSASFTANGNVGNATQLAIIVQPGNSQANVPVAPSVQVEIRDAFGNRTASTANVTMDFGNNPGAATLFGTTTVAAVAGVATFSSLLIDNAGSGYTLVASSGSLTAATSTAFDISGGVPAHLEFISQPANATAGAAIASFQVAIRDVNNNNVLTASNSVTLNVTGNPAGVTLGGTVSAAPVNGVVTFANITVNRSGGGYTLTAASAGLASDTSNAFTIVAGPASQLVFTTQPPATVIEDAPFVVEVSAQDALGNIVTTFTGSVTVAIGTNPSGGTLAGTTAVAAIAGTASFGNLAIDNAGTGYTLAASATGLSGATSNPFDVGLAVTVNQWTNTAGGDWSDPGNWSKGAVPTAADTVAITLAGTYTVNLNQNATIPMLVLGGASGTQTLQQTGFTLTVFDDYTIGPQGVHQLSSGGVLTGNGQGQVLVAGLLDFTGGTISSAHLHVPAGGELYVTGNVSLSGDTVIVDGELDVGGSTLLGVNNSTIVTIAPGGLLEFQSGGETVQHQFGGLPLLTVEAGATVDVGAAASFVSLNLPLVMNGAMSVPSGTLNLNNTVTVNGTVTIAAGTQLTSFGTVTFSAPSSLSGAGAVRVTGGVLSVGGTYGATGPLSIQGGTLVLNSGSTTVIDSVTVNGGQLNNTSQLNVTTRFLWQDGTVGGSGGVVQIPGGAELQLQGAGSKNLQKARLDLSGTLRVDAGSAQTFGVNDSSIVRVLSGGLLLVEADHNIQHQFGMIPSLQVLAGGELRRSAGVGAATLNLPMTLDGALNNQTGQLDLQNTVVVNGSVTMSPGTLLRSLGTTTFGAGSSLSGPVSLHVPAGTFTMNGTYGLTGQLQAQGGVVELNTPVSLASVALSNGQLRNSATAPLTVTFALNWTGGTLGGLHGPISIPSGGTFTLSTATAKNLQRARVDVAGQFVIEGGPAQTLGLNDSTQLRILAGGSLDVQGDHSIQHQFGVVPLLHVQAGGSLTRSAGTGTVLLNAPMVVDGGATFASGTLDWNNTAIVNGTVTMGATSQLRSFGALTIGATGAINGAVPLAVPGGTFTVNGSYGLTGILQVQGGAFVLNAGSPLSITQVQLTAGSINNTSPLSIAALSWGAGTIGGSGGAITVTTATLAGGGPWNLQKSLMDVTASLTMAAGPAITLGLNDSTVLRLMSGSFLDIEGDHSIIHQFGTLPQLLVMAGSTMRRNSGTGTVQLNVPMQVDGTFQLFTGNFTWSNSVTVAGSVTLSTGTVTSLLGTNTWQAAATVTGGGELNVLGALTVEGTSLGTTGPFRVQGGTAVLNNTAPKTLASVEVAGGTLSGTGELTALSMTWSGGTIGGNMGTLIIPGASALTLTGGAAKSLSAHILHVNGTLTMAGSMTLGLNDGAQVAVNGGGVIEAPEGSIAHQFGALPLLFVHPGGTLTKAGGGTLQLNVPMQMQGAMSISGGGTLEWLNSVTVGGAINIAAANVLRIFGSNSWAASAAVTGGGDVEVPGGVLSVAGSGAAWGVTGALRIQGGTVDLDNTVPLNVGVLVLDAGILDHSGEVHITTAMAWNGGTIQGGGLLVADPGVSVSAGTAAAKSLVTSALQIASSAALDFQSGPGFTMGVNNGARIVVQGGGQLNVFGVPFVQHQFGPLPELELQLGATMAKSVGIGTATFDIPLDDQGALIAVNSGSLTFSRGGTLNNQAQALGGAVLRLGGGDWGISNDWTLSGSGHFIVDNAAFEHLNGNKATITGNMSVLGTSGRVDMTGAADSLVVTGNLTWNSTGISTLSNGTLVVGGDLSQVGPGQPVRGSANHVTVLNGSGTQTLGFQTPGPNRFAGLRVEKSGGAVVLGTRISVTDTLDLMNSTAPMTGIGVTLHNGALLDTAQISPIFLVNELVVRGQPTALPNVIPTNLTLDSAAFTPASFIVVGGDLTIKGVGPTHAIVEATSPSGGFSVGGNLVVAEDGVMNMGYPSSLAVVGNATFASNTANTGLTDGVLDVGGSFTQSGHAESFAASGNHATLLNAAAGGTISFGSPGAAAGSSHFASLTVNGGAPYILASDAYTRDLIILGAAGVTGPHRLDVTGSTSFATGPTLGVRTFAFDANLFNDDGITYAVDTTVLRGGDAAVPGLAYNHLIIEGADLFLGSPMSIPGDLTITGSFTPSTNNVTVGGHLTTAGQGVLRQQNSETITVAGDARFGGGDETGQLTSGAINVRGNFTQTVGIAAASFAADPFFEVIFDGAAAQSIAMASPGFSRFGVLRVRNTAAPVTLLGNTAVGGNLEVETGAALTGAAGRLFVTGNVTTGLGTTLTPRYLALEGALTLADVAAPDTLEWQGFGRLLATGPLVNPANVIVNGSGNWTITASDTYTGDFTVNQGIVTLNGNTLGVGGTFSTTGVGILEMLNGADQLIAHHVSFGGGDETGSLGSGTISLTGNFRQLGNNPSFRASPGLTVSFDGSSQQDIQFDFPTLNPGGSTFGRLTVRPGPGVRLISDVAALTLHTPGSGFAPVTSANPTGSQIVVGDFDVNGLALDNVRLNLQSPNGVPITQLDNVTITGITGSATRQIKITKDGASTQTFNNIAFDQAAVSPVFLEAFGTGSSLTITLVNPTPTGVTCSLSSTPCLVNALATVNWP